MWNLNNIIYYTEYGYIFFFNLSVFQTIAADNIFILLSPSLFYVVKRFRVLLLKSSNLDK